MGGPASEVCHCHFLLFASKPIWHADWWGWKLTLATGASLGAGTDADIQVGRSSSRGTNARLIDQGNITQLVRNPRQVRWECGTTPATNGFIPLTVGQRKLCGTSAYTRVKPPEGFLGKPQDCFER